MFNDGDDNELEKLLGELAHTNPLQPGNYKDDGVFIPPSTSQKKDDINISIEEPDPILEEVPASNVDDNLSEVFGEQLKKVASQYSTVFEEIITNYKKDREQAQEVIDQFMNVICTGGKVPRVYLEKVADAVRAKNEIAQTAIRALGELPKLMSATKNNNLFQGQSGINFDAKHLREILEAAEDSD